MMLCPVAKWWGHQLSLIQEMSFLLVRPAPSSLLHADMSREASAEAVRGQGQGRPEGKVEGKLVGWCWPAGLAPNLVSPQPYLKGSIK
jgi:hypothetical protein